MDPIMAKLLTVDGSLGPVKLKHAKASTGVVIRGSSAEPPSQGGQGSDAGSSTRDQ